VPRHLRPQYAWALYHIYIRGVRRNPVFHSDDDRERFMLLLDVIAREFDWIVIVYCLMGNHYHLAICTPRANIAEGMQALNSRYAQEFNRRYGFSGHVFEARYNSVLVEDDDHLQELAGYVVLNPVRAGLCEHPSQWRWSSYRATVGLDAPPAFLDTDQLLLSFDADEAKSRELFRAFVYSRLEDDASAA
jgi:putative transposase